MGEVLIKSLIKEKIFEISSLMVEYSLYGIIFFIPISKAIISSFSGFLFLGFLGRKIIRPDFSFIKTKYNFFLLLFILFSVFSLFNSGQFIGKSLVALFLKWSKYVLLFFIINDIIVSKKQARKAVFILFFSATLVSLDGVFQLFFGFDFLRHKELMVLGNGFYALCASLNHYNSLGAYLVVVLPLLIAFYANLKKHKALIPFWILLIIFVLVLLFTFSRGAWLGFVAAVVFMLILTSRSLYIFIFVPILSLVMIQIPYIRDRFIFIFTPGGDANRFETWKIAIDLIKEHPFLGRGVGTFIDYFPHEKTWLIVGYAHNCFLQIFAETGIFSLIFFLLFLFTFLKTGVKSFLMHRDQMMIGLLCGLFGFIVHSFFDTHFYSLQLSFLFWSIAGILSALIKINNRGCVKNVH